MNSKATLQEKSLEEIQAIAAEYGINSNKKDRNDLIYEILDYEASNVAAQKATAEKPRKRGRIKTVDHVYSASQDKTKKIDKQTTVMSDDSLFNDLSFEEKEMLSELPTESASKENTATPTTGRKRGRPRKNPLPETEAPAVKTEPSVFDAIKTEIDAVKTEPGAVEEPKAAAEEPVVEAPKRKRGRPRKNPLPETETAATAEAPKPEASKPEAEQTAETPAAESAPESARPKRSLLDFGKPQLAGNDIFSQASEDGTSESGSQSEGGAQGAAGGIYPDDGSDFIIIEDIPSEGNVQRDSQTNFYDKFSGGQSASDSSFAQANDNTSATSAGAAQGEAPEPYNFNDIIEVSGVLDLSGEFGFLRSSDYNYLSSPDDIYVNPSQVKHYGLKTGDVVEGTIRPPRENEKFFPLMRINKINGCDPSVVRDRVSFEYLTPLFPNEKFKLCSGRNDTSSSRIVDLFSPIGKGQRALIVAQPKTGKTLLMKDIANSIARNHPEAYLMMLLIDERPEEVTDMARTVNAEVIASTFDAPAGNHVRIANLVLEKAKRMVECGHDVVIFLDSITRLARAYNTVSPASGKVLTGGVDANALQKPKRFFGAARNIEGGGSLTIIATALIDTGSKMDEVIFEEFKGTGNMELQLDRTLANKRIFPAVNLIASSTRRDDLLQDDQTRRFMWIIRNHIADMTNVEAMDTILKHIERTSNNEEFLATMNG